MAEEKNFSTFQVAVVGAGPAGIFAARELAGAGVQVALINRDIKAGGLAEYGIYPDKYKMKGGLRRQFRQALELENIHYFGNLSVGEDKAFSLADLQQMGFDAVLVSVGAQGTKKLGLPGEDLPGVYHAKDLVYHYNRLPPFSQEHFDIGQRIVCIGVGNVMLDIAHWAVRELKVDELVAVARRGPAEVKFTKAEMETVGKNLDLDALDAEIAKAAPVMQEVGQDPEAAKAFILSALDKAEDKISDTRFELRFLVSPHSIVAGDDGQVRALQVEHTTLKAKPDGRTSAVGLGTFEDIPCDTVVFCIGDRVDAEMGLPLDKWGDFAKNPAPRFPVEETSYEAYDPAADKPLEGVFLAGWSREASTGLVGKARKDGTNAAHAILAYLQAQAAKAGDAVAQLAGKAAGLPQPVIDKADLQKLEAAEADYASQHELPEFKYDSNKEMLEVIGKAEAVRS